MTKKLKTKITINKFDLNKQHINILLALSEAPDDKKTIHYISLIRNTSFYIIYHDIKTLTEIDFIQPIKRPHSNKVLYFPNEKIVEAIKKTLAENPNLTED